MFAGYIEGFSGVGQSSVKIFLDRNTLRLHDLTLGEGLCKNEQGCSAIIENMKEGIKIIQDKIMEVNKDAVAKGFSPDTMKIAQNMLADIMSGKVPEIPKQISEMHQQIDSSKFETFSSDVLSIELYHNLAMKSLVIMPGPFIDAEETDLLSDLIKAAYDRALESFQNSVSSMFSNKS